MCSLQTVMSVIKSSQYNTTRVIIDERYDYKLNILCIIQCIKFSSYVFDYPDIFTIFSLNTIFPHIAVIRIHPSRSLKFQIDISQYRQFNYFTFTVKIEFDRGKSHSTFRLKRCIIYNSFPAKKCRLQTLHAVKLNATLTFLNIYFIYSARYPYSKALLLLQ